MLKAAAFLCTGAGIWIAVNVENLHSFLDAYHGRNQELERVELSRKRITQLQRQKVSLMQNGFEAERQARLKLGMQLPGENQIVLKPEETAAQPKIDDPVDSVESSAPPVDLSAAAPEPMAPTARSRQKPEQVKKPERRQ